ncbi:venom allergen 5-like isoform X2 [Tribolium madens]|uniref:venom allergen 5-like isoform X2 n=1 Tax=Tribolium madens TaxID=41895 RepID=UPI001CF754EC|nr:venom allergen 5-like isoform X2 [Tribolium madens]
MFIKTILFIVAYLTFTNVVTFDPRKKNYCNIFCKTKKHTGCDCARRGGRTEVELDKIFKFRKVVLDEHNKLRNGIASGNDSRTPSKASDMMAISYDLEMEYMCRCYLRSRFNGYHDECRITSNGRQAGQNLAGRKEKDYSFDVVRDSINEWFDEISYMEYEWFNKSHFPDEVHVSYFTAMAWSQVNILGCARVYTPDPKKEGFINPDFVQTLLCNYGITILNEKFAEINLPGQPVFKAGIPCTECPYNLKYPAYEFSNSPTKTFGKRTIFVVTFAILRLF